MTDAKKKALAYARRAARSARDARVRRDDAIRSAAGVASYREVAEAVGLSKPRIQKIVNEQKEADHEEE